VGWADFRDSGIAEVNAQVVPIRACSHLRGKEMIEATGGRTSLANFTMYKHEWATLVANPNAMTPLAMPDTSLIGNSLVTVASGSTDD
jgi:hypothetical protein